MCALPKPASTHRREVTLTYTTEKDCKVQKATPAAKLLNQSGFSGCEALGVMIKKNRLNS